MAEPPARRRHPEVHCRRRFGRHAALLLLRVPLPARRRGAEGSRRSRRGRAADRRCQEQQAQGQERQGAGGFPARREPRHDREGGPAAGQRFPARGQDQRHPAQQVHGAAEGPAGKPAEVWTGSTNMSDGGIHGQTNVGHWVRDPETREEVPGLLGAAEVRPRRQGGRGPRDRQRRQQEAQDGGRADPGAARRHGPRSRRASRRSSARAAAPKCSTCTPHMVDEAADTSCITLAFGINKTFKDAPEGQQGRRPYRLLPAREGGQAEPERQGSVRPAQRRRTTSTRRSAPTSTSRSINGRRRPTRASCSSIPT